MRARIYRGAAEVGGTCVELEAGGQRLVLDVGRPLTVPDREDVPLPGVAGGDDPSLVGVVLSHPHLDHFGLLTQVGASVPIYLGEAAARMLREAAFFTSAGSERPLAGYLRHRHGVVIGPFRVTPFLNDHSAFDAYSLLVEAGGRRLFYTGDIRAHGRKAGCFEELLRTPPPDIHVLLMEGTHVRADADGTERGPSERDVEAACLETCRKTRGLVLAMFSPQNIDRLVTIYRAARRAGRDLVIDLYTAAIAAATGRDTIPQADWDAVRVYLPQAQRRRVIAAKAFDRTEVVRSRRIYPEELRARRGDLVMLFRASMGRELEGADCLDEAGAIWSMWPGYLQEPSGTRLCAWLDRHGIPLVIHHTSGHAFIPDLQRLVAALAPARVVPIHSYAGDRFAEFFPRVERWRDGEWWDV
jgi:ribonuclease J